MIDRLTAAVSRGAAWLIACAALLIVFEVVARYAFNRPTIWAVELVTAFCAVAFFLAGAEAERQGQHIRIGLLYDHAPPRLRKLLDAVAFAVGSLFLFGLAWGAARQFWLGVWQFDATGWRPETTGRAWNVPLPPVVRALFLLASVLLFLQLLARTGQALRLRHGRQSASSSAWGG